MADRFTSVDDVIERLRGVASLADTNIAGVVYLADRLEKPVLVEGPAGVGKTELAKALSRVTGARLIRLQCYEGLDESKALYEWNYKKQLLRIQADREHETNWAQTLLYLGKNEIDPELIGDTLHVLLKYQSDIAKARKELQVDGGPLPARTP